jgi:creatinine amidohydrolase
VIRLADITSTRLEELRERRPVALWPLGAIEPHAGAVGISEATLRAIVLDVAASLDAQGFRRLVIVNNHFEPEQVATLRAVAEEAGALYLDLVRRRNAERLTDEFRRGSCHAGRTDFGAMGMADAYCGAPAEATADEGRTTFETLSDLLVELVREGA